MPLGMEVSLGPGDFVFDGDPATSRNSAHQPHPIFGPCSLWPNGWMDQDATWYVTLCWMGSQLPLKGAQPLVFGSCLLWPNGWMDEDATWYGSRPRPRPHCIRQVPSSPRKWHSSAPLFPAHVYCGHGRQPQLLLSSCWHILSPHQFC